MTTANRKLSIGLPELGFWVAAVILALVVSQWRHTDAPASPDQHDGRFASDVDGAIAEMTIHFTPETAGLTVETYADLFRAMAPDSSVHVAVPDRAAFSLFCKLMAESGVPHLDRFLPLVMNRKISTWSRDRYVPRAGDPRVSLLVPARPTDDSSLQRRGDWFVPWTLALDHTDAIRLDEVPLRFDGGDFVVSATTLFCDANLLHKNVPDVFPTRDALLEWLRRESRLRVELIGDAAGPGEGGGDVPDHHIGMYLSPLPDGRVMVAAAGHDDGALRAAGLPVSYSADFARRCEFVAQWLIERGYEVVRMPIYSCEDAKVFVTWNNVLCETRADGRLHVYMPVYGSAVHDLIARSVWESVGAVVHDVCVAKIFVHRGSVRCLTQVVRRR